MAPTRRTVLGAVAAAVSLAGCSGDEGEGTPTGTDAKGTSPTDGGGGGSGETDGNGGTGGSGGSATVQVRSHEKLGDVLVDSEGMTLYMFEQDREGEGSSVCYDSCAETWPPLTVDGEPSAGDGVTAQLSTFQRDDGSTQVAAAGWPLYSFTSDQQPGDAKGHGVGDFWWVLRPDGTPVRSSGGATPTPTPTSSDGGGGGDDDGGNY